MNDIEAPHDNHSVTRARYTLPHEYPHPGADRPNFYDKWTRPNPIPPDMSADEIQSVHDATVPDPNVDVLLHEQMQQRLGGRNYGSDLEPPPYEKEATRGSVVCQRCELGLRDHYGQLHTEKYDYPKYWPGIYDSPPNSHVFDTNQLASFHPQEPVPPYSPKSPPYSPISPPCSPPPQTVAATQFTVEDKSPDDSPFRMGPYLSPNYSPES